MENVKIRERWRGMHGSEYFYVAEGFNLIHIGRYAVKKYHDPQREKEIIYEIPESRLSGKEIYGFYFSNKGNFSIERFKLGESPIINNCISPTYQNNVPSSELYMFRFKNDRSEEFLNEFKIFIGMFNELRSYMKSKGLEKLMVSSNILSSAFEDFERFYYSFMCIPENKMRIRSWRNVRRWIYQLWVLKTLWECLHISKFYKIVISKGHEKLDLEIKGSLKQGSIKPICIGNSSYGDFTFLFEAGRPRSKLRPDIMVIKGKVTRLDEITDIDILIECKEEPFEKWKGKVKKQIIKYMNLFKPKIFILASMERIPQYDKRHLEEYVRKYIERYFPLKERWLHWFYVIDDLRPYSKGINNLCILIQQLVK